MKKLSFSILFIFVFSACGSSAPAFVDEKSELYEVKIDDQSFYFSYPAAALISDSSLEYQDCYINFGTRDKVDSPDSDLSDPEIIYDVKNVDGLNYERWEKDGKIGAYVVEVSVPVYLFMTVDYDNGVDRCTSLVDAIAESFTSEPTYINDKFGFSVNLPKDFEVEYLTGGEGVMLKQVEPPVIDPEKYYKDGKEPKEYRLNIVVVAEKNVSDAKNVIDYVGLNYPGYTIEFAEYDGMSGFFVDENVGEVDAIRHFFTMNDSGSILYEAYMKLPSAYYGLHKATFDKLVAEGFRLL